RDQALVVTGLGRVVRVGIRRIEQLDAGIEGRVQHGERAVVVPVLRRRQPHAPERDHAPSIGRGQFTPTRAGGSTMPWTAPTTGTRCAGSRAAATSGEWAVLSCSARTAVSRRPRIRARVMRMVSGADGRG